MSTTSNVMDSILAFPGLPKDIDRVIDPTGSILFSLKSYRGFVASFSYLL
jgi:hypothetical protein